MMRSECLQIQLGAVMGHRDQLLEERDKAERQRDVALADKAWVMAKLKVVAAERDEARAQVATLREVLTATAAAQFVRTGSEWHDNAYG